MTLTDNIPDHETGISELGMLGTNSKLRADCANIFAAEYADGALAKNKRRNAEKILKLFIEDSVEEVRTAVVANLIACPFLPKSLALTIASDVDAIAVPMIRSSEVFDDEDLLKIIQSDVTARQIATASRRTVSPTVSSALVKTGKKDVISTLLDNDGADIIEGDLSSIIDDFGDDPSIDECLISRSALPLSALEKLLDTTGEEFQNILDVSLNLPAEIGNQICRLAQEQVIANRVLERQSELELAEFTSRLQRRDQLTESLVLRALCFGNLQFFCASLAKKVGVDVDSIRRSVLQADTDALQNLYRSIDWPRTMDRAFAIVLKEYLVCMNGPTALEPELFAERARQRLVRDYGDLSPGSLDVVIAEILWKRDR